LRERSWTENVRDLRTRAVSVALGCDTIGTIVSEDGAAQFDRFQRWRLVLGKSAEEQLRKACGGSGGLLDAEQRAMDEALGAIYDNPDGAGGKRGAGLGAGKGSVAKWLGDIRKYFDKDIVVTIQKDAIARDDKLKVLLFEPELLAEVTPSVEMVGTLLSLKNMVPERAKEAARQIVRAVVEEIMKRMRSAIERAVRGALDRSRHQPLPSLPNIDWKRTIRRNLKNYVAEKRTVIPDRFFYWARQHRRKEYNVIVCMDQSGSMAESVVYGSVMGAIFATIPSLETHVIAFDTEVVDLTDACSDPVDMLFGVQLGGGTDIDRAVGYCQGFIKDPRKTLFILITDLYEGGNERRLVERMQSMTESGVRAVCLLALSDSGVPSYDENLARKMANVNVPCFACTPNKLPAVLEAMLKGADTKKIASEFDTQSAKK
jgi:Mg-chelatase subunit ChlD